MTPVERIQAERDEVRRLATDEYDAACDAARRLALDTLKAEHALEAEALRRSGSRPR
jgi:hypothetical protein